MDLRLQLDTRGIDWNVVVHILQSAGMAYRTPEVHERAFNRSHTVVFVFDSDNLVGLGRALSDGEYQAAIYDVAVLPAYQGNGIGRMIIQTIIAQTPHCNFILYASPGKEKFYEKENFRKMKTGMARFVNGDAMKTKEFTE